MFFLRTRTTLLTNQRTLPDVLRLSFWKVGGAAFVLIAMFGGIVTYGVHRGEFSTEMTASERVEAISQNAVLAGLPAGPTIVSSEDLPQVLGVSGTEVATYINRSFRVPRQEAMQMVEWAIEIGRTQNIDPLLILAVVGTESSYNAKAKSSAGAEGLMQVLTKVHLDKFEPFGGRAAALEPYPNMAVGTMILSSLIKRTGSVTKALKWYSGAALHKTDFGYGARVLGERSRLLVAANGNSDAAVKLSRTKKNGPSFKRKAVVKTLHYGHWTQVAEAAQEKALRIDEALPQSLTASAGPNAEKEAEPERALSALKRASERAS